MLTASCATLAPSSATGTVPRIHVRTQDLHVRRHQVCPACLFSSGPLTATLITVYTPLPLPGPWTTDSRPPSAAPARMFDLPAQSANILYNHRRFYSVSDRLSSCLSWGMRLAILARYYPVLLLICYYCVGCWNRSGNRVCRERVGRVYSTVLRPRGRDRCRILSVTDVLLLSGIWARETLGWRCVMSAVQCSGGCDVRLPPICTSGHCTLLQSTPRISVVRKGGIANCPTPGESYAKQTQTPLIHYAICKTRADFPVTKPSAASSPSVPSSTLPSSFPLTP